MKFHDFEKTDRKILGVAGALLVLSSALLWQGDWVYRVIKTNNVNFEQIGEVTLAKNDVRRRYETALSWLPLRRETAVYQGDSIFTGSNSTATIETRTGERISIAPNSLVVINQKKDSISLNIGFGSIEGKVEKGKKILISSNNSLTELAGDEAVVKIDAGEGNKIVLNVLAGEIRVRSQEGDKVVRREEVTEIASHARTETPEQPVLQLLTPLDGQKFKTFNEQPILFKWQSKRKFSRMKIKVSSDPEFRNTMIDSRTDDVSYSAYNLPKDTELYWKVITEGGASRTQKFAIVGERPPIPVFPKPGYQFFFDPFSPSAQAGSPVDLAWEPGSLATHYEIQLSEDIGFKKNLREYKTKEKTLALGSLPKGQYFWRLRSADFPDQPWSSPAYFKVGPERTRILASPVPQLANNIFLIPTRLHGKSAEKIRDLNKHETQKYIEKYPQLRWSAVAGAERYSVQISKNNKFTDLIVSAVVQQNFYVWKPLQPGPYFWRIKALGENYKDGLYTPVQELNIAVQPPATLSQALVIDEVPDPYLLTTPPPPLTLKWNPTVFTHFYEIELSDSSSFSKPMRFITDKDARRVQVAKTGVYYWRVRSLDKTRLPLSPFSNTYTLEFQRVYKDPSQSQNLMALYPKQQDSIILVGKNQSEINFKWTKPYPDANYRIELSYDPTFQSVFFSTETKENFYTYTDIFTGRVIYWRVRAEGRDFVTDWTGANRFLVSYEGRPFDFEQSDIMFAARLQAKERQIALLAVQKRRLAQIRAPAMTTQLQLDTPQLINPPQTFTIESNFEPGIKPEQLARQAFEKFYGQIRYYPTLRWQKVAAAERYVVEIARDRAFKQTISKTPAWDPFFTWETVRPGVFYYRIQAFNERYMRSQFSPIEKIEVTVAPPITTSPDTHVEVYDEPREMWPPPSRFKLAWRPVVFARGYELEFSEDKLFNQAKAFKTKDISNEIWVSKPALYYWRVRPINEYAVGIGPFSDVRSIEVIQTHRRPASVTKLTGVFPIDRTMLFVGKGLMHLAFHWIGPAEDSRYELELSTSPGFDNIIVNSKAGQNSTIVTKDLPEGKIYWRVRSGSTFSAVNEFLLRREREPYAPAAKATLAR